MIRFAVANRAAQREAIDARQHHVEHHQVEALGLGARERALAVADADARVAFEPEVQADKLADVRLILDDENARGGGRGRYHRLFTLRP